MKRMVLAAAAAFALSGCGTTGTTGTILGGLGGLLMGQQAHPAGAIVLDQTKLTAANRLATAVADNLTAAFEGGKIARSQDQDTARSNFCALVNADLAMITDEGGRALELGCRIEHHLDRAEAAFDARDAVAYADNLAKADTYTGQLAQMVRTANSRGTPE